MRWLDRLFPAQAIPEEEPNYTPAMQASSGTGRLEPGSDTWVFISAHASAEIARLREKNDSNSHDATATAELRGQIKALKRLLALGTPKADKRRLSVEED